MLTYSTTVATFQLHEFYSCLVLCELIMNRIIIIIIYSDSKYIRIRDKPRPQTILRNSIEEVGTSLTIASSRITSAYGSDMSSISLLTDNMSSNEKKYETHHANVSKIEHRGPPLNYRGPTTGSKYRSGLTVSSPFSFTSVCRV